MNNYFKKPGYLLSGLFCLMVTIVSCDKAVDNPFWDGRNEIFESQLLFDGHQDHNYGLMGGLVRLPVDGHDILLFSNVDVPTDEEASWDTRTNQRKQGTIWASFDGGQTWPVNDW